jgi:pimeloyl-ACP methyl ester carboxylesterase
MECTVKNLSIHYESFGQGQPVFMIHGYHVDYRLMSGCLEPIFRETQGYRRIYIDLPGMGATKSAPWIVNSDEMLAIIEAFIDEVIPGERFLLAGESYGGYLARGLIKRMADRVAGLMLLCPAIGTDFDKRILPEKTVLKKDEALLARLTPSERRNLRISTSFRRRRYGKGSVTRFFPVYGLRTSLFWIGSVKTDTPLPLMLTNWKGRIGAQC